MTIIAGIPSWVQMYFEKIVFNENKSIKEVFPELSLYVYGGVSYEPYKSTFDKLFGKKVDTLATFPASEGFFGYQDTFTDENTDLLLLLNNDIFYEFIKAEDFIKGEYERITLKDVQVNVNYLLIISTSAGLWGYNIGDTVKFTSIRPYRIIVSGRIKHFLSAFGEHVIAEEVETLETEMLNQNIYYKDLIRGAIIKPLEVISVKKGGFNDYMRSVGRLGGQNKVPRLSNDRKIADKLNVF